MSFCQRKHTQDQYGLDSFAEGALVCGMIHSGWTTIDRVNGHTAAVSLFASGVTKGISIDETMDLVRSLGESRDCLKRYPALVMWEWPYAIAIPQWHRRFNGTSRWADYDFAVFAGCSRLDVEVDGHQFHNATKEQAQHDRSRDRLSIVGGWQPARFTGSEAIKNPCGVSEEMKKIAARMADTAPEWWHAVIRRIEDGEYVGDRDLPRPEDDFAGGELTTEDGSA